MSFFSTVFLYHNLITWYTLLCFSFFCLTMFPLVSVIKCVSVLLLLLCSILTYPMSFLYLSILVCRILGLNTLFVF